MSYHQFASTEPKKSGLVFATQKLRQKLKESCAKKLARQKQQLDAKWKAKLDALKDHGLMFCVGGAVVQQVVWMLCPVQIGFHVMTNMVSIVPAVVIVLVVYTGHTVFVLIPWVFWINKGMLRPVSEHHGNTRRNKGQDKDKKRCPEVNKA